MTNITRCLSASSFRYPVLLVLLLSSTLMAQHGGHGMHPPMPDQKPKLFCRIADEVIEAAITSSSPSVEAKLDQLVELPKPMKPLRIAHYYPKAAIERDVVAVESGTGHAAVEILIEGRKQNHRRWLVADDQEHNRLVSYIGSWRYMAASDEAMRNLLFQQFETEFTRPARLLVRIGGENGTWQTGTTERNRKQELEGGYLLTVEEFFPHFAMDKEANKPINQSERRENPAALVRIQYGDRTESRWVFTQYPEFQMSETQKLPVEIRLDCPIEVKRSTPDFLVVSTAGKRHEVWTRLEKKQSVATVSLGQKMKIDGSPYEFSIANFFPDGRLVESITKDQQSAMSPILELRFESTRSANESVLLEIGRERVLMTPNGPVNVLFTFDGGMAGGGHP